MRVKRVVCGVRTAAASEGRENSMTLSERSKKCSHELTVELGTVE